MGELLEQGEDPEEEDQKADNSEETEGHEQLGAVVGGSPRPRFLFRIQRGFFREALFRPRAFFRIRLIQPERVNPFRAEWTLSGWIRLD